MKHIVGIYMLTNNVTNERYIGQSKDVASRFRMHKSASKNPKTKIAEAIARYGIENFVIDILCECSEKELDEMERRYISVLSPEYNLSSGGKSKFTFTDEVRKKISFASKRQWQLMSDSEKEYRLNHNLIGPRKGHAEQDMNLATGGISKALLGACKTAAGYHWEYV